VTASCDALARALEKWRTLNGEVLTGLNTVLVKTGLEPVPLAPVIPSAPPCGRSRVERQGRSEASSLFRPQLAFCCPAMRYYKSISLLAETD
jgi:hypothetical protein